jgi:transposase
VADTIIRTVELGVRIVDAALAGETTVLWWELLVEGRGRCPGCGLAGVYRDTVERHLSDVPVVGHPLELRVRVPRYRCVHDGCEREVFVHDSIRLARPAAATTMRCARFILRRLMLDKATVAAVARELGRSWGTVNPIAVEATTHLLLTAGPARLEGVMAIGVHEHKWAHVRSAEADGFVTVITDLTADVAGRTPDDVRCDRIDRSLGRVAGPLPPVLRQRRSVSAESGSGGVFTRLATAAAAKQAPAPTQNPARGPAPLLIHPESTLPIGVVPT